MIEQTDSQSDVSDADGFCRKIGAMVQMARDTPTFFDQARAAPLTALAPARALRARGIECFSEAGAWPVHSWA